MQKSMLNFIPILFLLIFSQKAISQTNPSIIPIPTSMKSAAGNIKISEISEIIIPKSKPEFKKVAEYIRSHLNMTKLKIIEAKTPTFGKKKSIVISYIESDSKQDRYALNINKNGVLIQVNAGKNAFYAFQTIIQLAEQSNNEYLPFYLIEDQASFPYRGMHLDVSRHFFSVAFIKQYIDLLARYKFNYFHWHLTDDQGWRIEIKKFPDLTEIGSKRKETLIGSYGSSPVEYDKTEYEGYYTQEEIADVVAYAQERFVEIIPEIEMPGHSAALLASYPQFACSEGVRNVATTWGVTNNAICPTDTSLWFMKEILNEVCDLFPGKYIHIGGDEVVKDEWMKSTECAKIMRRQNLKTYEELQSYFIKQIDFYLNKKGKTLIGWDEILEGGLSQNAVVMSWRGIEGGVQAAKQKHPVIFTPGAYCYFDHYQSISNQEPLAIGGFTSLEKVYSFNPLPKEIPVEFQRYVLGSQGNVWTEYIPSQEQLIYMAFPRAIALSEVNWSSEQNRNYSDFVSRLGQHIKWFKSNNLNISTSYLDLSYKTEPINNSINLKFIKAPVEGKILFETYSKEEGIKQEYLKNDTITLSKDIDFKAWFQLTDHSLGRSLAINYKHHKFCGKIIKLTQEPSIRYNSGGNNCIINGIDAPNNKFSGPEWLGFDLGKNMEAYLENTDTIRSIQVQVFQEENSWIYLPSSIEIYASDNGLDYKLAAKNVLSLMPGKSLKINLDITESITSPFIKLVIKNHGQIEEGSQGAGHGAWLFVGEITAN